MKTKKIIPVVLALCAAACGGCNKKPDRTNEYDALNAMLDLHYSQVVLTVTEDFGGDTVLVGEYTMKFTDGGMTVEYAVERFSELSLDSATPVKTTLMGEATVTGGAVDYVRGDEVDLGAVAAGVGLNFKEEYFENADLTGIYFKADVKNASGFMGAALMCTEMKVDALFLDFFFDITVTYETEGGSRVEYKYVFGA